MRPLRLDLEGFTSFREPTTVDFADADYFVLVGPTGSGKSSLIDAMAFALYGCIPRYEDRRLVAPIITQGQVEARVGFEFAIGAHSYRAVRVVRQTGKGKGATTKEARLERIDASGETTEVLAGDADAVTREVERLLGLGFDHFTKCVVLPQGAFAKFLHDKASDRGDLLVKLLDLGVYARVAGAARVAADRATQQAASLASLLTRAPLVDATPEALAAARSRVSSLNALRTIAADAQPELDRLEVSMREAGAAAAAAAAQTSLLLSVRAPGDVAALAEAVAIARDAAAATSSAAAVYEKETLVAEEALGRLPARSLVEASSIAHGQLAELTGRLSKGAQTVAALVVADEEAAAALAACRADADAAVIGHQASVAHHHAAALARHLTVGDACPVCAQPVTSLPPITADTPDLDAADARVFASRAALAASEERRRTAAEQRAQGEALLASLAERRDETMRGLGDWPSAEAADAALAELDEAARRLAAAQNAERVARGAAREAAERLAAATLAESGARSAFDTCRDLVAALGPPSPGRRDLASDWAELETWAAETRVSADEARAAAAAAEVSARDALADLAVSLEAACAAVGVSVQGQRLGEAVAAAQAAAQAVVVALEAAAAEAIRVQADAGAAAEEAAVAKSLSLHLNAAHFEKWLLDEALALLVEGATLVLGELSGGAYSLTLDGMGGFAVIDHRNADAVRSARTLSGGETFLASLALALALADRLSELAAEGSARLESIFLDEGFGSLDADTLDTVGAAIEALAANGRVVGLVTHVRELAERVPVRFEVSKTIRSSAVERVEA